MTIVLPKTIERYFQASNAYDEKGLRSCFTTESQLVDEGQVYHEVEEIVTHLIKTNQENLVKTTVLEFIDQESEKIVKARIEGLFPGSPLDLTFYFKMSANEIMALKIL